MESSEVTGASISDLVNFPIGTILVKAYENEEDFHTIGKWVEVEGMQLIQEGMVTEYHEMRDTIKELQSSLDACRYRNYE